MNVTFLEKRNAKAKYFFTKSLIKGVIYYEHEVIIINFIPIVIINKNFIVSMKQNSLYWKTRTQLFIDIVPV